MPEQIIVSYPRELLSQPFWKKLFFPSFLSFPTARCGNAMFLFETFFVCFLISFEIELKPARFVDSSVSSRIFLHSEIYDARLTYYIYNISFFDDNIFRGIFFRKNLVCFQKWSRPRIIPFPSVRRAWDEKWSREIRPGVQCYAISK